MPCVGAGKLGDSWRPMFNPEMLGIPRSDYMRKYNTEFISHSMLRRFLARVTGKSIPIMRMSVDVVIRYNGNKDSILQLLGFSDTELVEPQPVHITMFRPKALRIAQQELNKEMQERVREINELEEIEREMNKTKRGEKNECAK